MMRRLLFFSVLMVVCLWCQASFAVYCEGASAIACYEGIDKSGRSSDALFEAALQALGAAKTPAQTKLAQQAIRDAFDPAMSDQRAVRCNAGQGGPSTFQKCMGQGEPATAHIQSEQPGNVGRHFATIGAFEITRLTNPTRCIASRSDYSGKVTLLFEVNPRHTVVLVSNDWRVPVGIYPVKIGWVDVMPGSIEVKGQISEESGGKAFVLRFANAADIENLVNKGWLSFNIGSHEYLFNMGASNVVSELSACDTHDIDPFGSMK